MNDFIQGSSRQNNEINFPTVSSSLNNQKSSTAKMTVSSGNVQMSNKTNLANNSNFTAVANTAQSFVDGKNDLKKKKKSSNLMPTIRFELNLEPPTSEKFSEFNYNKLVVKTIKIVKKKNKSSKSSGENNVNQIVGKNDLPILASEFVLEKCRISTLLSHYRKKVILGKEEETNENDLLNTDLACETNDGFGNESLANVNNDNDEDSADSDNSMNNGHPVKSKKSKKKANKYASENNQYKIKDFNYLGQGYDDDDSFIDNSEAIDDKVPVDMVPKKGGFYINKGNLKMEKIEEQKQKRKAKRQEEKAKALKVRKGKIKNDSNGDGDEDSSEDEDYNPDEVNEGEALASVQDGNNSSQDDDEDEDEDDDESDSDSDSDSDNESESDEGESEIDEVSDIEGQNLQETNLRNKKSIKNAIASDSDCEIIEISSSNSNSSAIRKQSSKRRIVDEDEMEEGDDDTAGKENIENKLDATGSNQNAKRKRPKENSNDATIETGEVVQNSQPSSKLPRNMQPRGPDAEHTENNIQDASNLNQSLNYHETTNKINNNTSRRSLPGDIMHASHSDIKLTASIPSKLKEMIAKFISMYFDSNRQNGQCIWTEDMKRSLLKIYKDSNHTLSQSDKSQVFTYISLKIGKKKDTLIRHCRNQMNKEPANTQPQPSQLQAQNATKSPQANNLNRPPSDLKQAYYQKLNNSVTKTPDPKQTLTFNDLNETLQNKLTQIEKNYQQFKQKNEPLNKFFEFPTISQLLYNIDMMTKITGSNSQNKLARQTRDFTLEYLMKSFDQTREQLLKTLISMRNQHTGALIQNKITVLKKFIDEEMPKQLQKYKQTYDEYVKNKAIFEATQASNPDAEKKKSIAPRRKFEWTLKIRDTYLQIIQSKMSLYRSTSKPLQSPIKNTELTEEEQAKKIEYLKAFLANNIINLWPENWMQMNVLINMYNVKVAQTNTANQNQQTAKGMNSSINKSINPSTVVNNSTTQIRNNSLNDHSQNKHPVANGNGNIINIASKSGKKITLEHQPLSKPQLPPSNNQSTPIQSTSRPTTPIVNQRVQNISTPDLNNSNKKSPPIINLTNTPPSKPNPSKQQVPGQQTQQVSPSNRKNNIYDNLTNQQQQLTKASMSSTNQMRTPTLSIQNQQAQQKLQLLQQQMNLNIFNANSPNSQFNPLNLAFSPNNSYSKNNN